MKPARALLVLAEKYPAVLQHRSAPDPCAVQPPLAGEEILRLLVNEHTVLNLLGQAYKCALVQFALAVIGGTVSLRLLGGLLEKALRVGRSWPVPAVFPVCKPQMTAEMAAAAAALLDERKLPGGIYASAETALDIGAILALTFI